MHEDAVFDEDRLREVLPQLVRGISAIHSAGVQRSLLTRLQIVRSVTNWLRGRLLLATSAEDPSRAELRARAARRARRLEREGVEYAAVWGDLLYAAVAAQEKDEAKAQAHLREAEPRAARLEMWPCLTASWARRGDMIGGNEGASLVDRARKWAESAGVANPRRHWQVHTPGFGR